MGTNKEEIENTVIQKLGAPYSRDSSMERTARDKKISGRLSVSGGGE